MSPSATTYVLPFCSNKSSFSAFVISLNLMKSLNEITSAQMKPRSKSECIFPAACGARVPFSIVHALTSSSPAVKYEISPSAS